MILIRDYEDGTCSCREIRLGGSGLILIKGECAGGFQGQVSVAVNCGSVCGAGVWCALCSVLGARRDHACGAVGRSEGPDGTNRVGEVKRAW